MKEKAHIPEWNKKFAIGVDVIDLQHEFFLNLIRRIHDIFYREMPTELINDHIDELILYAKFHFRSEENLMKLNGYPDLDAHKRLHLGLLEELQIKICQVEDNLIDFRPMISFLVTWFVKHTTEEDIKFKGYIKVK